MTRDEDLEATIVAKFVAMAPVLNERARRLWAAAESIAIGSGGDASDFPSQAAGKAIPYGVYDYRPHEPLRVGVAVWSPNRRPDDSNALAFQKGNDRTAPLRILIADQNATGSQDAVHTVGQVAHRLKHKRFVRVPRGANHPHPTRVQLDDEHGVVRDEPTSRPDLRREEVSLGLDAVPDSPYALLR